MALLLSESLRSSVDAVLQRGDLRHRDGLAGHPSDLRNRLVVTRRRSDYADVLHNRGDALMDLKRPDEALASYERKDRLKRSLRSP